MTAGTDEKKLTKMFEKFGDIIGVRHKGSFAFIEFIDCHSAANAIKEMNEKDGIRVQRAFAKN